MIPMQRWVTPLLVGLLSILVVGSLGMANTESNGGVNEKTSPSMVEFGNSGVTTIDNSILAINVDNLQPDTAKMYISTQISKLKPVIVVGNPQRILHDILNSADVAAVPVATIINGKEVPIEKVVIGYIPRRIGNRIGGQILCQEYNGVRSLKQMYQKIKKIKEKRDAVVLSSKNQNIKNIKTITKVDSTAASGSSGSLLGELSYSWEFSPYGILSVNDRLYMMEDLNPTYNWFTYHFVIQTEPGDLRWKNGWRNADLWNSIDVDAYDPPSHLSDYGPTTTVGASTISVSISASASDNPGVSVGMSWAYSLPDVVVHDLSSLSRGLASWWHDIDESKFVGGDSYKIQPGAMIRVSQSPGTYLWRVEYGAQWGKKVGDYCIFGHCLSHHWEYSGKYGKVVIWGVKG
jgi:hypothetical protein